MRGGSVRIPLPLLRGADRLNRLFLSDLGFASAIKYIIEERRAMIEIGMNRVTKNYGFKNVLSGCSFTVFTGERAAIVGHNGTGKTTILKIIAGQEREDAGMVNVRRGATIGYLEQIPSLLPADASVRGVLTSSFENIREVEARLRSLEGDMALAPDSPSMELLMKRYASAQSFYESLGGYAMEEELNRVISGFNLTELMDRPFNALSGGEKTIVKMAATILSHPDILLLDEPTNHLDMNALEWFEEFIAGYRGTVLMVSHDRYFLDRAPNKIIFLAHGECETYSGNYTFSVKERERQLLIEFEQYKTQRKKIEAIQAAIKRYRDWARQSDNEKFYRKAKELEKRLEKMEILDKPELEKQKIPIKFSGGRTGREVLRVKDFSLAFGDVKLFEHAGLLLVEREKLCLMGDNGTGKTSLIKAMMGDIVNFGGMIAVSPSALIGYIPQEIRFTDYGETALDAFKREYVCSEGEARNILAKYFFVGDRVYKRVSALSGGEKVLIKLAALMQRQINFLVLDEPTNHIDVETREILENALAEFTGTLLFISHDRYFIRKISSRVAYVRGRAIISYAGGYDEYRKLQGRNPRII
jgi:ATPase subunit of ABC transporter with duplicated ATPase domains